MYKLRRAWRSVVELVGDLKGKFQYSTVWQKVSESSEVGSAAKLLIDIDQATARDTSCCERWFSLMNRLKDKRRNRMNTEMLNNLMFLCLHAPRDIKQLQKCMPDIIKIWKEDSKRGRYKARWVQWEATVAEMNHEEEVINELRNHTTFDMGTINLGASEVSDLIEMK